MSAFVEDTDGLLATLHSGRGDVWHGDIYNWDEAFKYAKKPGNALPTMTDTPASFTRFDVEHIEAAYEGENDGDPWRIYGRLKDGRWFYLEAWCDYTGWG